MFSNQIDINPIVNGCCAYPRQGVEMLQTDDPPRELVCEVINVKHTY